jgi:sulfide:quinone oxidoreductase
MTRSVVVLGGGTGGTLVANRLRRRLPAEQYAITVVDQDNRHVYQPGLLFVPFGKGRVDRLVRSRQAQLAAGVTWHRSAVERLDLDNDQVHLSDGEVLPYDVCIIATGAQLAPDETEGMTGPGWMERVFTFYTPEGAAALSAALARFERGRLVINVVDMPIKCPVAPLEFAFLADAYFRRRGIRDQVELVYASPLDGAFTKPTASRYLGGLLDEKGIEFVGEFNTGEVDGIGKRLVSYDGREIPFDLAVTVPAHSGAAFAQATDGLADGLGFVLADEHTLQSKAAPNVFVIGDAAGIPASKAGSVAHFAGEVVVDNVSSYLANQPLDAAFDGHANCFIETGDHKALLIDFNYETEPLPGHYPAAVGLPLLKPSRANHAAKLAFESFYWHALLPGRDVPLIGAGMPMAGKTGLAT